MFPFFLITLEMNQAKYANYIIQKKKKKRRYKSKISMRITKHYEILLFIAPNIRSRRSSTVQLISFVDKDDDAECPGPRFGRKLNEPESTPCERFSINRPICAEELWKILQRARQHDEKQTLMKTHLCLRTNLALLRFLFRGE